MKTWLSATCPICGFRYPLTKFKANMQTIEYPLARMTGGGRGKGFHVQKYLPWATLPKLKNTDAWICLQHLYNRLAFAYDTYYLTLGFLSPEIEKLVQTLQGSYAIAYSSPLQDYTRIQHQRNLPTRLLTGLQGPTCQPSRRCME